MLTTTGTVPKADELLDQLAIERVIYTHSRGLDRLDVEVLASCYWPESEVDYGNFKGNAHTFCTLVVEALPASYELTQHKLGNTLVEISGGSAKAESYVTAYHLLRGAEEEMVFSGRYLDKLECRDGVWKILHRSVVMDWSRNQAVRDERAGEAFAALQKGKHAAQDPLSAFLKL
ncbi:MAG: nuclear transport factor 2 family protein [Halioglobus sp.]